MQENKRALGKNGEDAAARYLENAGYVVIARNVYAGGMEADILCVNEQYFCFVEVKTRRISPAAASGHGRPADAVDARKREHMIHMAQTYLASHPDCLGDRIPRLDIVEVYLDGNVVQSIRHYPNAVRKMGRFSRKTGMSPHRK